MPQHASVTVGHYVYTAQDAQGTLNELNDIWGHHIHKSSIPDGWLAGARGYLAEMSSLAGISLPSLDNVDNAFAAVHASVMEKYDQLTDPQIESLLAAMWRFFPTTRSLAIGHIGTVAHLHASKGLPKKPLDSAVIGWKGVEGDVQSWRVGHGRPWQALCIWSDEVINQHASAGHPIARGSAGENITISQIDWSKVRPGAELEFGSVRAQITGYAIPCKKNSRWFSDGDYQRLSHELGAVSRVYCLVTQPGKVSVGDTAICK